MKGRPGSCRGAELILGMLLGRHSLDHRRRGRASTTFRLTTHHWITAGRSWWRVLVVTTRGACTLTGNKGKAIIIDPDTGEQLPVRKVRGSKAGGWIELCGSAAPLVVVAGEGIETALAGRHADDVLQP